MKDASNCREFTFNIDIYAMLPNFTISLKFSWLWFMGFARGIMWSIPLCELYFLFKYQLFKL